MQRLIGIALISMLMTACVSMDNTPTASPRKITPEMLLDSSPLAEFGTANQLADVDMLAITPEIRAFLDEQLELADVTLREAQADLAEFRSREQVVSTQAHHFE